MKPLNKTGGFTLIEIIIYIALFTLVVGGMLLTTYAVVGGSGNLQSKVFINEESVFIMRKLNWALTGAISIVPNASTLTITQLNPPSPLVFALNGDGLTLSIGGGPAERLNSQSVQVISLSFINIPPSGSKPAGVEAQFTLKNLNETQSFDVTTYLR
ncbi:MAG: prepilin-type N-terminal cleavage/methylation domain-containing protein [Patescibacteria group bacterium]|nr:prepilin-type N-terminal cleavage/methylation domain-containing protein [Patescibacteria group bacterium]MDE2015519.1 prepilin-type N-terminal cleavage/methylation domain-containing protein [Patescibacteria group bacterium]MDE2226865.1 prepilin-type N-terminal cleavage/methylation domain-containing protein [Patescibacteria group bacterium]